MVWKLGEDKSRDLDSKVFAKNLTTRSVNPSRPVLHAAMAYWETALELRNIWGVSGERAERVIVEDRRTFQMMLTRAEAYRRLAPGIPGLGVKDECLIEFRAV